MFELGSEKDAKAAAKRIDTLERPPREDVTTELEETQEDGTPAATAVDGTRCTFKNVFSVLLFYQAFTAAYVRVEIKLQSFTCSRVSQHMYCR